MCGLDIVSNQGQGSPSKYEEANEERELGVCKGRIILGFIVVPSPCSHSLPCWCLKAHHLFPAVSHEWPSLCPHPKVNF